MRDKGMEEHLEAVCSNQYCSLLSQLFCLLSLFENAEPDLFMIGSQPVSLQAGQARQPQ